ncbi:MAG: DNA repair protein RecN [Nitriliruptoraceae bacterium]
MIEELHIRALGVLEDASLQLAPGLTVVTGETGAGKTMLVTAMQLLIGARADTDLVRAGAEEAVIEAVIDPVPAVAGDWVDASSGPLIVSREIPANGRSRARMNGRLVPIAALQEVLGNVVDVHAQHEHVRLGRPEVQRDLLDRFAGEVHARTLAQYREVHERWRQLCDRRASLHDDGKARARDIDRLQFEVDEIDAAGIDLDVDGNIGVEIDRLAHADAVEHAIAQVVAELGSDGAGEVLGRAVDAVRRLDFDDELLGELRQRLDGLVAEVAELSADFRSYGDAIEADPARLEELGERQRTVADLRRKYGDELADVLAYREDAQVRLEELEREQHDETSIDSQIAELEAELGQLAETLHHGRVAAGERLADVVGTHLADLGMPHAAFSVDVEEASSFGAHGADRIAFLLAPNPGEPARDLASAASGGERSRVSLAVEVALADVDGAQVLVFDEVDAGIGGVTATKVGEKLAQLARGRGAARRQVLCVTHLAQLAAFADVHHVVEKGVAAGRTVTTSRRVEDDARVGELSRMLGGDPEAAESWEHARALLDHAHARRAS